MNNLLTSLEFNPLPASQLLKVTYIGGIRVVTERRLTNEERSAFPSRLATELSSPYVTSIHGGNDKQDMLVLTSHEERNALKDHSEVVQEVVG